MDMSLPPPVRAAADGDALDVLLARGRPSLARSLRIADGLAQALSPLHDAHRLHGRLHPSAVRVTALADRVHLAAADALPTRDDLVYIAPEQAGRTSRAPDHRCDLYTLGMLLYRMLTGLLPFDADDALEWAHCHMARVPPPPCARDAAIPRPVSDIAMKLLAKAPEARYQTAHGLQRDLQRCLQALEAGQAIEPFALGTDDISDRFQLPRRLYGRDTEAQLLMRAFDRVSATGDNELVLVCGYAGIGKTSLVLDLRQAIHDRRGRFARGRPDTRDDAAPYGSIAHALHDLVAQLLGESEAGIAGWRRSLQAALRGDEPLLVALVPRLALVLGPQAAAEAAPVRHAAHRLHAALEAFIGVFASAARPLVLLLDDLQWTDAGSLRVVEHLLASRALRHLLLVGAFRDNEVGADHPLAALLARIEQRRSVLQRVKLRPLQPFDCERLVAEALHCEQARAAPLARLVFSKTQGNPFFFNEFLASLHRDGLIAFDHHQRRWTFDRLGVEARHFADNVAELVLDKLRRFPPAAQQALQWAGCLGDEFRLELLAALLRQPARELLQALAPALQEGLLLQREGMLRFLHERVAELAMSLATPERQAQMRLQIGRGLLRQLDAAELAEQLFVVAGHLNAGAAMIDEPQERLLVAALDLRAAQKAECASAPEAALDYLASGRALLPDGHWDTDYALSHRLATETVRCACLSGRFADAAACLDELCERARDPVDLADAQRWRVELLTMLGDNQAAASTGLAAFEALTGVALPLHPGHDALVEHARQTLDTLGGSVIEALLELPPVTDPTMRTAMGLLSAALPAAAALDHALVDLMCCHLVALTVRHGSCESSPHGHTVFGATLGRLFGRWRDARRFAQLGQALAQRQGSPQELARSCHTNAMFIAFWTQHTRRVTPLFRDALAHAQRAGDLNHAAFAAAKIVECRLWLGEPLHEVAHETEALLRALRDTRVDSVHDAVLQVHALMQSLRGDVGQVGAPEPAAQDERRRVAQALHPRRVLVFHAHCALVDTVLGRTAGAARAALDADAAAQGSRVGATLTVAESVFYGALALAAHHDAATPGERALQMPVLRRHREQLGAWCEHGAPVFAAMHALIDAELRRIDADPMGALRGHDRAIVAARANGFPNVEALACERTALLCRSLGLEAAAQAHLAAAHAAYRCWGADAKCRQLEAAHPALASSAGAPPPGRHSSGHLDALAIAKASNAISRCVGTEALLDALMRNVVQTAGAQSASLLLLRGDALQHAARAAVVDQRVEVQLASGDADMAHELPMAMIHCAWRTAQRICLHDAEAARSFAADPYLAREAPKSALCLPFVRQGALAGLLYLENRLAVQAFSDECAAVLELLASQAAIALDNARLVAALQQQGRAALPAERGAPHERDQPADTPR